MAYGTSTEVQILIGGSDNKAFSTARIDAALLMSDIIVDIINSGATDAKKNQASNFIAKDILEGGSTTGLLKGLSSDSGNAGRPGRSVAFRDSIPLIARQLLTSKPPSQFFTRTPESTGYW